MAKLLSSLPVGAKVKDTGTIYNGKSILWTIMQHGHSGDPAGSTALVTSNIITFKCFDAMEAGNSNSDRRSYGNNRYSVSNIRQWLNSDAAAGKWYSAQHSADAAPTNANVWSNNNEYDQEAGFLANFSANMKASLLTVTKTVAKNTVTDGGGSETVSDKIFLLSNTEVGLANENNVAEGSKYSLFSDNNSRLAYPTAEAVSKSEYKDGNLASGKPWYWWLRSPYAGFSHSARIVSTDGSLYYNNSYGGNIGVRPACAISSSALVSDSPDTDGAYTLIWNSAPKITTDTGIGEKNSPFTISYKVVDADGDAVTTTVKLDSTTVATHNPTDQTKTYTYDVTATALNALALGAHTFTITATDVMNNTSTVTINWTKTESPITVSGTDTDLGNVWQTPSYKYTVSDLNSKASSVVEAIDGETTKTIESVTLGEEQTVDFGSFGNLTPEQKHTLTITAKNSDGATAIRTITFTKLADNLSFYTQPLATDEAAKRVNLILDYSPKEAGLKVEVTNNALAVSPTWEDATEAYNDGRAYEFTNAPTENFGVAVKVTITKTADTERVYCNSLGFSFA